MTDEEKIDLIKKLKAKLKKEKAKKVKKNIKKSRHQQLTTGSQPNIKGIIANPPHMVSGNPTIEN